MKKVGTLTIVTLGRLFELSQQVRHGFMKEMLGEGLCIVGGEGRYHGDDHLAHKTVPMRLESQDLFGGVEKCFLHKLKAKLYQRLEKNT